jgi:uncharacterized protein (DUF934 family)
MAHLVRSSGITSDSWQLHKTPEDLAAALSGETTAGVLTPLPLWLASRDTLAGKGAPLGVWLEATDDLKDLVPDLPRLELIAVNFARFSDGRGYSLARLLRARYGYQGELRAVGDVLLDQLFYMMRVGFDAYALRDDQDPLAAGAALRAFTASYQAGADQPLPLFRQRQAVV